MNLRKIKAKILKFGIRYDGMNWPFKKLKRTMRLFIALEALATLVFFLGAGSIVPHLLNTNDEFMVLGWVLLFFISMLLWVITWNYFIHSRLDVKIDMLRRELWFIEHYLNLPHDPEELEDVEAYEKWLEEYIRKEAESPPASSSSQEGRS